MAKKKSKGNTGFRNDALFCFNCGRSYTIQYPQPITMAAALMTQFAKDHENCQPGGWKEPEPDMTQTESQRQDWWLKEGERGISSETMFQEISGRKIRFRQRPYQGHPSDPDDFKRCYLLLKALPEWKTQLDKMRTVSEVWNKLVDNWDKLTEMFEARLKTKKRQWHV